MQLPSPSHALMVVVTVSLGAAGQTRSRLEHVCSAWLCGPAEFVHSCVTIGMLSLLSTAALCVTGDRFALQVSPAPHIHGVTSALGTAVSPGQRSQHTPPATRFPAG